MTRTALIAAVLVCSSFSTRAADSGAASAGAGFGRWIAAQGNAALCDIADDLRDELKHSLQPYLPTPPIAQPTALSQPQASAGTH